LIELAGSFPDQSDLRNESQAIMANSPRRPVKPSTWRYHLAQRWYTSPRSRADMPLQCLPILVPGNRCTVLP
jgi:hypothetical protein